MTGEEVSGPAGPKVLRLLYFAGAGFVFTIAMNKGREIERNSRLQQQQQQQQKQILDRQFSESHRDAVQKVVE